jgi:hypothetical protein
MSSTATAPVAPATVHQSWWTKAATWLLKIGHAIKQGLADAVAAEPKIAAVIANVAPTIEGVSNLVVPGSGNFEAHVMDVYGYVAKAVADAGVAANSVSITTPAGSLQLDQQLVADIKGFLPAVQTFMHTAANPAATAAKTPAPAAK